MRITPKYGDKILSVPYSQVTENLRDATAEQLKVLIFALANPNSILADFQDALGMEKDDVKNALAFWRDNGAISVVGLKISSDSKDNAPDRNEAAAPKEKIQRLFLSRGLPVYNDDEVNAILRKRPSLAGLVDECNRILKTVMNTKEAGVILMLSDYLKLSDDYIMLLCSYCAGKGKTSLHYVKSVAQNMVENDITEYSELENKIAREDRQSSIEAIVRRLFGLGGRALSTNEKEMFAAWTGYGYPDELIEFAYEVTVDCATRPNIRYMHAVVSTWYEDNVVTKEDAIIHNANFKKKYTQKYNSFKKKTPTEPKDSGSFDTGDFFEAALKRSYGDE